MNEHFSLKRKLRTGFHCYPFSGFGDTSVELNKIVFIWVSITDPTKSVIYNKRQEPKGNMYTMVNFNPFSSFGKMVKNVSASQWYLAFISTTVSNEKPNRTVSASFQLPLFYRGWLKRTVQRYFKFIYRQSHKIMKTDRNILLLTSEYSSEHSLEITPSHSTTDFWLNGIGHVVTWFRHK